MKIAASEQARAGLNPAHVQAMQPSELKAVVVKVVNVGHVVR
jgi:hypothetical protein